MLKTTRILVVGSPGWGGNEFRKAAAEVTGVGFISVGFPELAAALEAADARAANELADRWIAGAEKVVEPSRDEIVRSGRMYAAMKALMDRHGARGITINCLGGFYGGHISAYPCLGFSEFNNAGLVGGCEADQMSALTMMTIATLTGRPGYISDPVLDTSQNAVIHAHCVAMTRALGPNGPENPCRIRSHMACRTKLVGRLRGDIEKLAEGWRMGWHRVTFHGDLEPVVAELCERWKFQRADEAWPLPRQALQGRE